MIREQIEIRDAIDTIFPISPAVNGRIYEQALMASGFEEGIKWADNNPKSPWISVNDDLPCNHEELIITSDYYEKETIEVITINEFKMIGLNYMILCDNKWKWKYDIEFYYWMPIPEVLK